MERVPVAPLRTLLTGIGMGAADVVPGVSGGTIAFISGLYERLIHALKQFDLRCVRLLLKGEIAQAWQHVDATFLLILFAGVATSVLSLAHAVSFLLTDYPELLWGFFFGLIVASVVFLMRTLELKDWSVMRLIVLGTLLGYWVTLATPASIPLNTLTLFVAGAIAICAMILPGVSGSFLLLLMGMYSHVIEAIKQLDVAVLGVFAAGCMVGLLSIAKGLSYLFAHYHKQTIACLTGFMLGSLNKVWPWKQTLAYRIDRHGDSVPVVQANVSPGFYELVTGDDAYLVGVIGCSLAGFAIVFLLARWGAGRAHQSVT